MDMPSRHTNNFPESGRGLGHVTPTILAVRSAILATAWLLVYFFYNVFYIYAVGYNVVAATLFLSE